MKFAKKEIKQTKMLNCWRKKLITIKKHRKQRTLFFRSFLLSLKQNLQNMKNNKNKIILKTSKKFDIKGGKGA